MNNCSFRMAAAMDGHLNFECEEFADVFCSSHGEEKILYSMHTVVRTGIPAWYMNPDFKLLLLMKTATTLQVSSTLTSPNLLRTCHSFLITTSHQHSPFSQLFLHLPTDDGPIKLSP